MTSMCNGEWLTDIVRREWLAGFGDGLLLGVLFVCLVVAMVVTYAMSEVEP